MHRPLPLASTILLTVTTVTTSQQFFSSSTWGDGSSDFSWTNHQQSNNNENQRFPTPPAPVPTAPSWTFPASSWNTDNNRVFGPDPFTTAQQAATTGFQATETVASFIGPFVDPFFDAAAGFACETAFANLMLPDPIGCTCGFKVGAISASLKCSYTRCLLPASGLFCGGGSFETDVDIESQGIVNDLTSCLFLTAGLPVGSLDDLEFCYTAEVTNGNRFTGCSAKINVPLGTFTDAGGACECTICPVTGVAVDIDCSMVNIGAFGVGIPGPRLEYCALADFVLDESLPTLFPALFPASSSTATSPAASNWSGKGMASSGKMGRKRKSRS